MAIVRSAGGTRAGSFPSRVVRLAGLAPVLAVLSTGQAAAQILEATGSRALGMGGAFVAVADDASATWWNPAGLAEGPFLDVSLARAVTKVDTAIPARRDRVASFAIGMPPFGVSYYRLRLTEIRASGPTGDGGVVREEDQGVVPVRALVLNQYGATILRTVVSGVHVGTTLKFLRGTPQWSLEPSERPVPELLEEGDDLQGGESDNEFDLDVGVLAVRGPIKAGAVVRNLIAPEFEHPVGPVTVQRQVRVGVAFDGTRAAGLPLTVSFDADLRRYATALGDRRVVAVGMEQWFFRKRLGVRAGGRVNTVGAADRAATAGTSVALVSAVYVDMHVVYGGTAEDEGWGLAVRVSF